MGIELEITRELATISATLMELAAVANTINSEMGDNEFTRRFNKIVNDIGNSYDTVTENLLPLAEFGSEEAFINGFDARHAAYSACYLTEISRPRSAGEDAYEEYLVLQNYKEFKTGFPLLKRSFERFRQFFDKWVDNDAWLAMSVDNLFKRLQSLLNEVAALKQKDPSDAYVIYRAAFDGFSPYLQMMQDGRDRLASRKEQSAA
jgi:hypothetical protein